MPTNSAALSLLLVSEHPSLLRRVRRLVGADSAEDVVQKIWLKVQAIKDDPPIIDKAAYLHRLAHNVAFDHMKGEQRQRDIQAEAGTLLHDGVDGISGERITLARHDLMRVQSMIASLPDRTREIFLLSRLEGLPQREIAARLGVSRPTVDARMARRLVAAIAATVTLLLLPACSSQIFMGIPLAAGQVDPELQLLATRARAGDKLAQLELGILYEEGRRVERDLNKAHKLYRLAASEGGGPVTVYVPGVRGASGRVMLIDSAPKLVGLEEARRRLDALDD